MFRSFQTRLILFSWLLFVLVEAVTYYLVQSAIQNNVLTQAQTQLTVTQDIVNRRVTENAAALAEGSTIMAWDFGFRQAVASDDRPTIRSTLHNLASRINADRVMLVSLDSKVLVDTGALSDSENGNAVRAGMPDATFAFPDMIETADTDGRAAATTVLDNRIYQLVVVPILAPEPIAWIVVGVETGNSFASELQHTSTLPIEITFAFKGADGAWKAPASTLEPAVKEGLLASFGEVAKTSDGPVALTINDSPYVTQIATLAGPEKAAKVDVILQYSLDVALAPYQSLFALLLVLTGAAMALGWAGAVFIARSIAKPIRVLDLAARRIQAGRYGEKVKVTQRDELGRLSETFNQMMDGIAEREDRIAHQARHDSLSGLPNRVSFEGHVSDMINARSDTRRVFSVLLIQIGRFSELNNTLGHDTGEQLMRKVGKNLQRIVPQPNAVARHANSMFAVVLDFEDSTAVLLTVERVLALFDRSVSIAGFSIDVTATIGEARYPEHGITARILMQRADTAIYEAKRAGRSYAVYDAEHDPHKPERLSIMGELRHGLDEGQFRLFYQPKVDLSSERITAVEALIRWVHPKRGFMAPDDFIPLAEQTGNIQKLTGWVLGAAVRQSRQWADKGIDVRIAVNLSARDLTNRHLPGEIANLLNAHAIAPRALILEITESAVMEDPVHALEVLRALNAMGLTLSIDDYGTGYSSMSYLKGLPVQEIKIDKSFVLKLAHNRGDLILVRSAIELGHNLDLKVTAEGIEDAASLAILQQHGCETGQGYFISKPLSPEEFEAFYATSRWAPGPSESPPKGIVAAAGE